MTHSWTWHDTTRTWTHGDRLLSMASICQRYHLLEWDVIRGVARVDDAMLEVVWAERQRAAMYGDYED